MPAWLCIVVGDEPEAKFSPDAEGQYLWLSYYNGLLNGDLTKKTNEF